MSSLGYASIFLGSIAIVMIAFAVNRISQRRFLAGAIYGFQSLILLFAFIILLLLFSNLNTYNRLTAERDIAHISVTKIAEQQFQVTLDTGDNPIKKYNLSGDEWRLEVRIIKWKGWANMIGLDSYYQLDRLSGRYQDISEANALQPAAYQITGPEKGLSIWKLKRLMDAKLTFLDAYFGQSVFMPMRHLARYRVAISQTGLVARPVNEVARQAMTAW